MPVSPVRSEMMLKVTLHDAPSAFSLLKAPPAFVRDANTPPDPTL